MELAVSVSRSAQRSRNVCCLRSLQQWVNLTLQHGDHLGRQDSGAEMCRHMGEEYKVMHSGMLQEKRAKPATGAHGKASWSAGNSISSVKCVS